MNSSGCSFQQLYTLMTNILFNSLAANLQYDLTKLMYNYRLLLALHEISRLGTVEAQKSGQSALPQTASAATPSSL